MLGAIAEPQWLLSGDIQVEFAKEVGLWEVVASWRDLGLGNKLGKILLLDKVYTSKNNQLRNSRL